LVPLVSIYNVQCTLPEVEDFVGYCYYCPKELKKVATNMTREEKRREEKRVVVQLTCCLFTLLEQS
jgi:hypothetical protein